MAANMMNLLCRRTVNKLKLSSCAKTVNLKLERNIHRWEVSKMIIMKERRKIAGPPPKVHRSMWQEWNRTAEIYAFGKRLNEEFKDETLEMAFTHQSYIEKEEKKRENLEIPLQDASLKLLDNSVLISEGTIIMTRYILAYLRHVFPFLPEEGIWYCIEMDKRNTSDDKTGNEKKKSVLHDYLMSDDVLSHISFNIGTEELILCEEDSPSKKTLANTLKAIIGAIQRDQNLHKAEIFVQDFVLTQLIGKDIQDLWEIPNPMIILSSILEREESKSPEPRLLWKAGTNTILAAYYVGIYLNKVLLGKGPGETIQEAVDVAARDALNKMFQIEPGSFCLPFGDQGHKLQLDKNKVNMPLMKWTPNQCLVHQKNHKSKIASS